MGLLGIKQGLVHIRQMLYHLATPPYPYLPVGFLNTELWSLDTPFAEKLCLWNWGAIFVWLGYFSQSSSDKELKSSPRPRALEKALQQGLSGPGTGEGSCPADSCNF